MVEKDSELAEFDDFEEKVEINIEKLLEEYSHLSEKNKIIKLNLEEKNFRKEISKNF